MGNQLTVHKWNEAQDFLLHKRQKKDERANKMKDGKTTRLAKKSPISHLHASNEAIMQHLPATICKM
eukprot:8095283-Ditylum_brightwellii.AAC.1